MRTVIYARYSSQLQNSRSTADQVAACRERAAREGWEIVGTFADDAISGAAGTGEDQRPGLNALLARVEQGGVEQVLADTTSRIARNQGDGHHVRDFLNHFGARLFTLADGEIDPFKGAIKGLLDEQQRRDLAHNIKRGQAGTVRQQRVPAGLAFGYRTANRFEDGRPLRGLREIEPDEAAIVLRIFAEAGRGDSPRAIARRLNAEGVPGPGGRPWRASTIAGDARRKNGMLRNRLYAGTIVHNRTSKVVDPRTRRTLIRPNPESEWISTPAEHLRIVGEAAWCRVQERLEAQRGERPEHCRRPKHMLSGLAVCGVCGGGWSIQTKSSWGCGRYRDGGGCSNDRRIRTDELERRVLDGLDRRLLHPDVVAAHVREYHGEFARRAGDVRRDQTRLERRRAEAERKIARFVAAIGEGRLDDIEEIAAALKAAKAERAAAEAALAEVEAFPVIALHPNVAADYRRQVAALAEAARDEAGRAEVVPVLRALIEQVRVSPDPAAPRGVTIEIGARLQSIIALATGRTMPAVAATATGERVKGIEPSS